MLFYIFHLFSTAFVDLILMFLCSLLLYCLLDHIHICTCTRINLCIGSKLFISPYPAIIVTLTCGSLFNLLGCFIFFFFSFQHHFPYTLQNEPQFKMEMAGTETGNVPKSFSLNMFKDFVPMCVFSEASQGEHHNPLL